MISLPNPTAQTTIMSDMILYTCDDHACAYTVDSEGTLYYIPLSVNDTLNFNQIEEVDYDEIEELNAYEQVKEIHDKLISMMKVAGLYYQFA